ncbi:Ribonuclease H2 subunit A [Taphrina deformans PYCC 5710]|uniref:Ribonuclease n=1 Tax=Taphrina deformans (strain PYCC 5710 / ATCC 11124 / CBS 356.35 / IMI 108563 / JCM 9778 / NBRC 8474) TaxID=1097556 RepID=R4XAH8_TAPDE|nr:Ribonuclease H2 subunit A [Taphrina deformans PYCC 5710]|eukprot:CCG82783.1 Ribonuclease H2 subunit A [Taphrina deformans PYCC 5710]
MSWQPPSTTCSHASLTDSYSYITPIPDAILQDKGVECILGVDEAGRGPVLGPMVYGVSYCSIKYADSIAAHGFMDSKVLNHGTRESLLQRLCNASDVLSREVGWSVRVMSARDIGSGMLRPTAPYNLNAQAHDTTIQLIRDVLHQGVNVRQIFVDTVGVAESYQAKLQREFPMAQVTVTKKADSLFPIVSVASICAKVTRDKALLLAVPTDRSVAAPDTATADSDPGPELHRESSFVDEISTGPWGSGYPSDARTQRWLRDSMDPVFGWSGPVRYSWSTVKDMLDGAGKHGGRADTVVKVNWFDDAEVEDGQQTLSFTGSNKRAGLFTVENHFGRSVGRRGFVGA